MSKQQVTVPDIGGAEAAEVIEVLVAVGDEVAVDQGLIVLESDKASMEIPSTLAGTVVELLVAEGQQLAEGAPVAIIEVSGETLAEPAQEPVTKTGQAAAAEEVPAAQPAAPVDEPAPAPTPGAVAVVEPAPAAAAAAPRPATTGERAGVYAGPAVRKLAREFGVTLQQVSGTGPRGRVLKEDLQQFVQKALSENPAAVAGAGIPAIPEIDFARFGPVEITQRSKLDKLTAGNMQRSWLNVPHVTQFD
ncbi:MAG: E3 binding domain-containing protein, partial [Gammaproteobacteria bacterium]|nr:E3 binding domain-containing protein [Gammaproteobacteria bacterium]